MSIVSTPILSDVLAIADARAGLKLSGSMRAAIHVDFLVLARRVFSTGPGRANLGTGLDELIDEAVVDVDFWTFYRVAEFTPQSARTVTARDYHHVIL